MCIAVCVSTKTIYAIEDELEYLILKFWFEQTGLPVGLSISEEQATFAGMCQENWIWECREALQCKETDKCVNLLMPLGVQLPDGIIDWFTPASSEVDKIAPEELPMFDIGGGNRGIARRISIPISEIVARLKK